MNHTAERLPTVESIPTVTIETETETAIKYCENCGKSLGRVKNKKYCTGACKVANHRKQKAKATAEPLQKA